MKIAARHLPRRGGVIIGDVMGLGKTIIAIALERTGYHLAHLPNSAFYQPPNE